MTRLLLPAWLALVTGLAHAADADELLPPDQAFALRTTVIGNAFAVTWEIAPGYYLYRDKFKFEPLGPTARLGTPELPEGKAKDDPYFGRSEIYIGRVTARVPFERTGSGAQTRVRITAQGCNEPVGVCYPPMTKEVVFDLADGAPASSSTSTLLSPRPAGDAGGEFVPGFADGAVNVEDAFRVEVVALDARTLGARFSIADCCYLYKDKISFSLSGHDGAPLAADLALGPVALPAGEMTTDEFFGRSEVYRGVLDVRLPLPAAAPRGNLALNVTYQGCAEKGVAICYPPLTQRFPVNDDGKQLMIGTGTLVEPSGGKTAVGASGPMRYAAWGSIVLIALGAAVAFRRGRRR